MAENPVTLLFEDNCSLPPIVFVLDPVNDEARIQNQKLIAMSIDKSTDKSTDMRVEYEVKQWSEIARAPWIVFTHTVLV